MRIKMKETRFGSPNGIAVNEYEKDKSYDVTADLAKDFLAAGVAISDEPEEPMTLSWPPTDAQIDEMSFSALGVLLEGKGAALGPLKSVETRQAAIRELIAAEAPLPWPPGNDEGKVPDAHLARELKARGVDISTLTTREAAEAKLRELMGLTDDDAKVEIPTDAQIDEMDESAVAALLTARTVDVKAFANLDDARAKLKELAAEERTAQE